ncbi:TRAP transporter substrate-binding protein [Butyrivibrio sp. XB500-5]|uniref:TRAP transporter substrate-binding protein n=1 Tax=Butyrivibrio sp. XB500-5 TaxID=2364880 RepID=UPI000EA845DC|nr:TRAP transporter substrate-binding protein [Butyrivibrio sp. XB500-5]RKM62786.1 TRAP transporter substrate-binding protein [Butyrivibrio sp. XB500-5]
MKKRWIIASTILFAAAVAVVGIWFFNNRKKTEKAPEYVLMYAENQSANYPTTLGGEKFADLVYERTNGRIKIQIKYGAELGSEAEAINQMKYGGIAFARVSVSQLAEKIPEMNVLLLPYLYDDSAHMWRVLEGEIGDEFLKKTENYNLVGLSWYDAGARNFYSADKPITSVEDCAGMNIRVQESAIMADMISALGANPIEVVYSDVYSALEQGIVDAAENNWPSYESMNHYKVAKYYTIDEHVRVPEMQICSEYVWNMFSDSDKEIITECAKESAQYERKLWIQREERSKKKAIDSGTQVTTLSPEEKKKFRDAMSDVYVKYCGDDMDLINKIIDY